MVVVSGSVPKEEPLNVGESMGYHVCDFGVEVAESGHGLWLRTKGEVGDAHRFQQGLHCVGHSSSAGRTE